MAPAGTLQTYNSRWCCMVVMNSWYEGHWDTKAFSIQLPGRYTPSQTEVTQWRLIFTSQNTLASPFFVKVCKEVSPSAVYSVSTPGWTGGTFGRGTGISGRTPPLWMRLPPMLSQCLGSSLLSAKRRRTEQQDRDKGNVGICGRPRCIRECYRAGELKQRTTVNKKKSGNIRRHGCYSELDAHDY